MHTLHLLEKEDLSVCSYLYKDRLQQYKLIVKLVKAVSTFRMIMFYHKQFMVSSSSDDFETNLTNKIRGLFVFCNMKIFL